MFEVAVPRGEGQVEVEPEVGVGVTAAVAAQTQMHSCAVWPSPGEVPSGTGVSAVRVAKV